MTDSPKHTPWSLRPTDSDVILNAQGIAVVGVMLNGRTRADRKLDSEVVVRAVNSHDALVSALRDIVNEFGRDDYPKHSGMSLVYLRAAREALKNAEGGAS